MHAFAGQSEQQPLHFAVIFGRSTMSCFGTFYGRHTYGYFISTFSIPIGVAEKSFLLSILNTFKKGHQQEDLIIDSRFISLNEWPEWLNFWGIPYIEKYVRRKHKFTPLKFDMDTELDHTWNPELSTFSIKDQGPSFFRIYSSMFLRCSSFHYISPLHGWVSYLQ